MSADLKDQLGRSWPAFFAPHGSPTEVQRRAMQLATILEKGSITQASRHLHLTHTGLILPERLRRREPGHRRRRVGLGAAGE